jgi:hypothetical protein
MGLVTADQERGMKWRVIVGSSIQIDPAALNLHVGLIHPPGAVAHAQMGADPLLQFGCISLDPAKAGAVIHLNAAVHQHQLEIAIADGEHDTIGPHRITSAVTCRPLKA